MSGSRRTNPLRSGALTLEDVGPLDRIVSYVPDKPETARRLTIVTGPYIDESGDNGTGNLVVEVEHPDGHTTIELTSEIGLTGDRYTAAWTHVVVPEKD